MSKFISIKNVHVNETDIYVKKIMCINCFLYKHCKISKQLVFNKQNVSRNICPLKIKFLKHLEENFRFIMYTCTLLAAIGKVVKEILSYPTC